MVIGYETKTIIEEGSPTLVSDGPMDSAWPMFGRDARHTGRSPNGASGNFLYEKWKIRLDAMVSFSSPAIDNNGTIYIGSWYGTLFAINPNGTEKWKFETPDWNSDMTSPAIGDDGTIYIASKNSYLYALYQNGTEKWRCKLKRHIISSPAIADDGTIYIGADEYFYAVYPNGTIKWQFVTGNAIKSSPAIGQDGTVYISSHDGNLYALFPENGTLKWKVRLGGYIYSSPAVDENGIIYVGNGGMHTYPDLCAVYPDGTVKWKHHISNLLASFYGGPVTGEDGVVYASVNYNLHAFNHDGSTRWKFEIWEEYSSPAIANNGNIYTMRAGDYGGDSNIMSLISPNGEEISSVHLYPDVNYDYAVFGSSPAIGPDGTVYVGSWYGGSNPSHAGYLHAIGTIENEPPNKPTITGSTNGEVGKEYSYTLSTTDPDLNPVSYYIDWGDGTNIWWLGPYESDEEIYVKHIWSTTGTYTIKAKARDGFGGESDWGTLEVSMPKNKAINTPFFSILGNHPNMFPVLRHILGL